MRTVCALAPWEYPGADFDPNPHAFTRHVFAGKERELWLKMRDGVIYFGEVEGERAHAVPSLFDDAIAADAERLIAFWKSEVERENYGAFIVIRNKLPRSLAVGSYCVILRGDGSGWIKEHFDGDWREFSYSSLGLFRLWGGTPYLALSRNWQAAGAFIAHRMQTHFLARAVDAAHFQAVAPFWTNGDANEVARVLRSAAMLFDLTSSNRDMHQLTPKWIYQSNSLFWNSVSENRFALFPSKAKFIQVQTLVKWHYAFVGLECKRISDDTEVQNQMGYKTRKSWLRGLQRWGENWRGNWWTRPYDCALNVSPPRTPSQHDKLEAALTMRDFLRGRWPDDEVKELTRKLIES